MEKKVRDSAEPGTIDSELNVIQQNILTTSGWVPLSVGNLNAVLSSPVSVWTNCLIFYERRRGINIIYGGI